MVDDFEIQEPKGTIYGFPRAELFGKDDDHPMRVLLTPDEGEGTCLGFDVRHEAQQIKERVGYMTQKFSYYEDLSIRENLDFVARMYRLDRRKERVDEGAGGLASGTAKGSSRARCRAAGNSGWRSRRACCTTRNCCCSMSRRRALIRRRGATSGTRSGGWRRGASRCWSRPTTWTRRCSATSSPTSPMGES